MEWFKEAVGAAILSVLAAWHWYDKSKRDERFVAIETRMANSEEAASRQRTQIEVLTVELKASRELSDVRLEHMQESMDKMVGWMERQMEKPHG